MSQMIIEGLMTKDTLEEFCECYEILAPGVVRVKLKPDVDKAWFINNVVPITVHVEFE